MVSLTKLLTDSRARLLPSHKGMGVVPIEWLDSCFLRRCVALTGGTGGLLPNGIIRASYLTNNVSRLPLANYYASA